MKGSCKAFQIKSIKASTLEFFSFSDCEDVLWQCPWERPDQEGIEETGHQSEQLCWNQRLWAGTTHVRGNVIPHYQPAPSRAFTEELKNSVSQWEVINLLSLLWINAKTMINHKCLQIFCDIKRYFVFYYQSSSSVIRDSLNIHKWMAYQVKD